MKDLILNVYSNKWIGEEKFDTYETTDHSLIPALDEQHKRLGGLSKVRVEKLTSL